MVAYSFQKRFIDPVVAGLEPGPLVPGMKRQTIRAPRKRHARPGEVIQLYAAMRTKHCRRIGSPTCTAVQRVRLLLPSPSQAARLILYSATAPTWIEMADATELDIFARWDGFHDFDDMAAFWRDNHPGVTEFAGVLVRWQPAQEPLR
ncbi:MAG TPA: hypothetical protein VD995_03160 [Azospirillum sp.]|nr:hypothetical protein [Azospirillum sp.]